jgi:protein phosphatase
MIEQSEKIPRDEDIDVFGLSHIGKVRRENQDQFLVASLHKTMRIWETSLREPLSGLSSQAIAFLMMVADGVGGSVAGQKASGLVLEAIAQYVSRTVNAYLNLDARMEDAFLKEWQGSILEGHEAVCAEGERHPEERGMATTLTMVTVIWPRAYVIQVGDSRCYQLRNGELTQLTTDQTLAQALIEQGVPREQVNTDRLKHVLASAIGSDVAPVTTKFGVQWDDVLMLCTDGLTNHLSDAEIRDRLLTCHTAEDMCESLVSEAVSRGGSDNVTVVVGRLK